MPASHLCKECRINDLVDRVNDHVLKHKMMVDDRNNWRALCERPRTENERLIRETTRNGRIDYPATDPAIEARITTLEAAVKALNERATRE